jgi:tRNA uridine 5-carboxymethylaminomethyl modification enzyme
VAALPSLGVAVELARELWQPLEVRVRYRGYIERQQRTAAQAAALEAVELADSFWDGELNGLSREAIEKLRRWRPRTVGMASRLAGVSPADVAVLLILVRRWREGPEPRV